METNKIVINPSTSGIQVSLEFPLLSEHENFQIKTKKT